jgi:hypothetical protein
MVLKSIQKPLTPSFHNLSLQEPLSHYARLPFKWSIKKYKVEKITKITKTYNISLRSCIKHTQAKYVLDILVTLFDMFVN